MRRLRLRAGDAIDQGIDHQRHLVRRAIEVGLGEEIVGRLQERVIERHRRGRRGWCCGRGRRRRGVGVWASAVTPETLVQRRHKNNPREPRAIFIVVTSKI